VITLAAILGCLSQYGYYGRMKTVASTEAKNRFGAIIDDAQREPVVIRRQDRERRCGPVDGGLSAPPIRQRQAFLDLRNSVAADAAAAGLTEDKLDEILRASAGDRVVIDTNVFISGVLSTTSAPARLRRGGRFGGQLIASHDTLRELFERLLSAEVDPDVTRARREELLARLAPLAEIVEIVQQVRAVGIRTTTSSSRPR